MKRILTALLIGLLSVASAYAQKSKADMTAEINTNFPDNTTGLITPAILRTTVTDLVNSYQQYARPNVQSGTTYTVVAADYGQLIKFTNSASIAVALPQATSSFSYFNTYVTATGTGVVTITPATSTINGSATLTVSPGQQAWIISDGTNYVAIVSTNLPTIGSRTLKDAASFTLTAADCSSIISVDTQGSVAQNAITVLLPALSSLPSTSTCQIILKKVLTNNHPGNMIISAPVIAQTTGSASAGSAALTVASATGIADGQYIASVDPSGVFIDPPGGIKTQTKVSGAPVGTAVTLSQIAVSALSSQTLQFYTDGIDGAGPRSFEIPGQAIAVYSDAANNNWNVVPQQMSTIGAPISGHHDIGVGYSVASPWNADASTSNTQMFQTEPDAAGNDIKLNLAPTSLMAQGYAPATLNLMRGDAYTSYLPFFYTPNGTWNQASTYTYPVVLEGFADSMGLYTDGAEYRTLYSYDAHKNYVNNLSINGTNTERTTNTLAAAAATIYAAKTWLGDHISLPMSTDTTTYVWQMRRAQATVSHLLSASTYGYAASPSAVHNAYMWVAPDGSLQLLLGAAGAGSGEYSKLDGVNVNTSALPGGVGAKSARLMAFLTTNGSSQAIYITDQSIAPTQFAGRIGVNTSPPSAGNATVKIIQAPPDGFASVDLTDDSTYQASLIANSSGTTLKNVQALPIIFGTNNTTRWTIGSTNGGLYSANATGGSKGADTINTKGLYVDGNSAAISATSPLVLSPTTGALTLSTVPTSSGGTGITTATDVSTTFINRTLSAASGGSTNNSSSGSGAYVTMTPSVSIPANFITTNRLLKIKLFFLFNTGTPTEFRFNLRLGGTVVAEAIGSTPTSSMTNRLYMVEIDSIGLAAPSASSNVATAIAGNINAFAVGATILNQIAQPVALATNGALTLDCQTQWVGAGTGTNTATLTAITVGVGN